MKFLDILEDLTGFNLKGFGTIKSPPNTPLTPEQITKSNVRALPAGRVSDFPGQGSYSYTFEDDKYLIHPGFQYQFIPLLRQLSIGNQAVSQALGNIVNLANTGHKIVFDATVSADQAIEMITHLEEVIPTWQYGVAGFHGLANKLFSQAMIAGAVCAEVVPNKDFTGVRRFLMPLPETIRFVYDKPTMSYLPYQVTRDLTSSNLRAFGLKPLNINSFRYIGINGDTEQPYGNPPYLPAIPHIEDQQGMLENIKFIIQQVGIVGFLEVLVDKPNQIEFETDTTYAARLEQYLTNTKLNVTQSMRDGLMVGLKDDHEFKFNSITKNASGVSELFDQNEILVSSGLKQDPSLAGKAIGTETGITIIFTKLISELKNIQISVSYILKFAVELELRMAGYNFKSFDIVFDASTIQDDLKLQQAQEIKIRNQRQLTMDGIQSQDDYANNIGRDKAHKQTPLVPYAPNKPSSGDPNADAQGKAAREKKKDVSDKKVRSKNKPQQKTIR